MATQIHIVTGKGGTGKTTVAAALAMALASKNKRVLLCEVEGRQGIAQLFDVAPLPYEERQIAIGLGGGEVYALAIDAESALLEYLQMYYRLGRAGKALDRFGIIDFATTIAPGVRDVLLTGKVYEAARRPKDDPSSYDAIVLDAPPTGRITRFLNVNAEVAGLAKVGPIRRQAESIMGMLRASTTQVHVVTVLEEMPVQETTDGLADIRATDLPVGKIIINLARPPLLSDETAAALVDHSLDAEAVSASLASTSLDSASATALISEGESHQIRQALQQAQRDVLDDADAAKVELPFISDGIDLGGLFEIAEHLKTGDFT